MNFLKLIKKNVLFSDFSDKEINSLFDCMQGRIVMKSKGMLIAKDDAPVDDLCIILEGTALEFLTKLNGEKEPIATLTAGEMFGLHQGYLKPNTLGFFVVAASDVTLLYMKISTIVNMCSQCCPHHQTMITNVIAALSRKVAEIESNNSYITIKGMRQKIARLIYDKYLEEKSMSISLGMDRNQMAAYLNVSRPSMSREMMRMRDEGIFDFWKDKIDIKDIQRLENLVKGK
ncbi:MAG: Crp/Fnr family transcriptional regulator [Clostridia bacterium]|nr:Crp/Fnr family transcriptional regulator [Clostridia bacterium]